MNHGIYSLNLSLDRETYSTGDHGSEWAKLKRIFINGNEADPDTLYRLEEFLYKHCGEYFFYGARHCDRAIYEFKNEDRIRLYDYISNYFMISGLFYVNKFKHENYKDKLPKCDEIN